VIDQIHNTGPCSGKSGINVSTISAVARITTIAASVAAVRIINASAITTAYTITSSVSAVCIVVSSFSFDINVIFDFSVVIIGNSNVINVAALTVTIY